MNDAYSFSLTWKSCFCTLIHRYVCEDKRNVCYYEPLLIHIIILYIVYVLHFLQKHINRK